MAARTSVPGRRDSTRSTRSSVVRLFSTSRTRNDASGPRRGRRPRPRRRPRWPLPVWSAVPTPPGPPSARAVSVRSGRRRRQRARRSRAVTSSRSPTHPRRCRPTDGGRELDDEGAPHVGHGVHVELAAHALAQVLGQRQAHAGPLDAGLLEPEAVEGHEDAVQVLEAGCPGRCRPRPAAAGPARRARTSRRPVRPACCTSRRWTTG